MAPAADTRLRPRGTTELGARIRELRKARGYSLRTLSDECDGHPSRTQLHEVEHGKRGLRGDHLLRVAEALEVDPDELVQLGGTLSEDLLRDLLSGRLAGAVQRGRLVR